MSGHGALWRFIPRLRARDGDDCALCGEVMDFDLPRLHGSAVTVDHIRPRAAGGRTWFPNLQLAHRTCGQRKGAIWEGVDYAVLRDPVQDSSKPLRPVRYRSRPVPQPPHGGYWGDPVNMNRPDPLPGDWDTPVAECWPLD